MGSRLRNSPASSAALWGRLAGSLARHASMTSASAAGATSGGRRGDGWFASRNISDWIEAGAPAARGGEPVISMYSVEAREYRSERSSRRFSSVSGAV